MRTLAESDFMAWIGAHGLRLHDSYPATAILTFGTDPDHARFWTTPAAPERRPHFIATMLNLLGDWSFCSVWKHSGSWPISADPQRANDVVELQILSGLGLPLGTADIVQFDRTEFDPLVTLIFSTTIFGWSVGDDLYVIPHDARWIMQTDHHDVIHVSFRNASDLEWFVGAMASHGFPLPGEVPDATFKTPDWMKYADAP